VSLERRLDREAMPAGRNVHGDDAVDLREVERGRIERTTGHVSICLVCATALTMLQRSI